MQLYLIRHAQSSNNTLTDARARVCDPPLTELGQRQTEILATHLASGTNPEPLSRLSAEAEADSARGGYGLTRLYCSAMWRSLQTARPIGQALGLTPEVWLDIHEHGGIFLDHGEAGGIVGYPGKNRGEILTEFPHYLLPETITEQGWWTGGFEDLPACQERALRVAQELGQQAASDERIALVSHGAFLDVLLKTLLGQLPGLDFWYAHYNTAISRLDFRSDGRLVLRYLNRVEHLPLALVS